MLQFYNRDYQLFHGTTDEFEKLYVSHSESGLIKTGIRAENWCVMPKASTHLYFAINAGPIFDDHGESIAVVTRYGGEEFAVIHPGVDLKGAIKVGKMIINSILELNIPHVDSQTAERVTISCGSSSVIPDKFFRVHN